MQRLGIKLEVTEAVLNHTERLSRRHRRRVPASDWAEEKRDALAMGRARRGAGRGPVSRERRRFGGARVTLGICTFRVSFGMTMLDEIEAKLAAAASGYFGMALPADAVEVGQRIRAEQESFANDESLPLEERLQAAFRAFNRAARPWRYLQLFVQGLAARFRDPAVAARVLVEQWSDFDAIPHALFVDLVFPHLSPRHSWAQ